MHSCYNPFIIVAKFEIYIMELSYYFFTGHLEDDEKILFVAHRHFFILFKDSVKTFFLGLIVPILLFIFFPKLILFCGAWMVVGILGMFYNFVDWYFDAWIVTNLGIIDIERNGLFDKQSKRVEYEMIDGIEYKITGVWPTIFNFGDLAIDTMGTNMSLLLKDAANPKKMEKIIVGFQEKYVSDKSFSDYNSLKDMLASMLAYHSKHGMIEDPRSKKGENKVKQK